MAKRVEGDKRTPLGVYFTTARLAEQGLGKLYGSGAMPLNYPNAWDRLKGRTGYGIWLHGVPYNTYNRPPLATNGCVALPNSNFTYLADALNSQATPVVIVDGVRRIGRAERLQQEKEFSELFERWQLAWRHQDEVAIKAFYAPSFRSDKEAYKDWLRRLPKRVQRYTDRTIKGLNIFRYPGEEQLVLMAFEQISAAGSIAGDTAQMRQYWRQNSSGTWQIESENRAKLLPIHLRGIPSGVKRVAQSPLRPSSAGVAN